MQMLKGLGLSFESLVTSNILGKESEAWARALGFVRIIFRRRGHGLAMSKGKAVQPQLLGSDHANFIPIS